MLETKYSGFWSQYDATWSPGPYSRQRISRHCIVNIGLATCRAALLWIVSSSVEQNLTYDTKCEYIFKAIQPVKSSVSRTAMGVADTLIVFTDSSGSRPLQIQEPGIIFKWRSYKRVKRENKQVHICN